MFNLCIVMLVACVVSGFAAMLAPHGRPEGICLGVCYASGVGTLLSLFALAL